MAWLRIACLLLVATTHHVTSDAATEQCPQGQYYVRALGGYVLIPARYMPYAFELEVGITGSYKSPSPPMGRRCISEKVELAGGNIQTGTLEAIMRTPGNIPAIKPASKNRLGEFEVTVWSLPSPANGAPRWWTVLITNKQLALRIFDTDPELWRRILDSYSE